MNFFGYQEQARKNSAILIALFVLSVILITVSVYFAIVAGILVSQMFIDQAGFTLNELWNLQLFFWSTVMTLTVILGGSAWRIHTLSEGGGAAVARMLGGNRLPSASRNPLDRRLLNVVEEMAIASGLPVPPVFILEQAGINAFAAGFTPSDVVIGVTRGAVELLNRDELQGVVAHEFSHILNGDSAMKMRMMGMLYGITLVSDMGIMLMTMKHSSRYGRDRGSHPGLIVIGFFLFMVGTIGVVMADFIKRAVSRQREFLADASAVQFTRNPSGIADALKVIGGYKNGSKVSHVAAGQASHFFFGNAIKSWYAKDWWATHPPLDERIRRIEPGFKGKFDHVNYQSRSLANSTIASAELMVSPDDQVAHSNVSPEAVMSRIGTPDVSSMQEATLLMAKMPSRIRDFSHDPYTARAAVYALLLDRHVQQRRVQLQVLEKVADPSAFRETLEIQPEMEKLAPELRLPLAEMVLPALKEMSPQQFKGFKKAVVAMIKADNEVTLFEFILYRMVIRRLNGEFSSSGSVVVKYHRIEPLLSHASVLIALLARTGHGEHAERVFGESMALLKDGTHPMPDQKDARLSHFDRALTELNKAAPEVKESVLKATVHCVVCNGVISVKEGELLRAVADGMDCPMPPLSTG